MANPRAGGAAAGSTYRSRPRAVLPALCTTQITSWGILYYAFPVLVTRISADTGWTSRQVTAAFSAALLVSALTGVLVGRLLDRRGPHAVMTTGSIAGVLALVAVALAPNVSLFFAGWMVGGAAMAATFYPPAFAAVTRWHGEGRVRALTILTLAGGLASTVFAPITAALAGHLSWRVTYLVLAAILAAVTIPLHALALRHPWPPASHAPAEPSGAVLPGQPARTRPFVLLAAAFTLSSFAMYAVVFGLIPLLTERGASPTTSAWALGLGGLGQTLGRTLYAAIARRTPPATRTAALIASGGVTTALLALVPGPVSLLVILAVLAGTVRGNLTLLQATAVTDRWGTAAYGHLSALLAAPSTTAAALAPWAVAALAPANGGHPALFAVLAALSAAAAALALRTAPPRRRGSAGPMRPAVAQRRVLPAQAGVNQSAGTPGRAPGFLLRGRGS